MTNVPEKEIRIAVIEDNRNYWIKIIRIIEGLGAGYVVEPMLVGRGDTVTPFARALRDEKIDIVLLDEELGSFKGPEILQQAGGDWFHPEMDGGNPRVISISSDPSAQMVSLSCACFTEKVKFIDYSTSATQEAERKFVEMILASVARIRAV